ncbi:hypothetical protein CCP2SC5_340006 [Azospirillaceae bacterium]
MSESSFKQFLLKEAKDNFNYNLGNAALVLNRFDEACELYERALACCPNHARALINLAKAYRCLEQHQKAENAERAAKDLSPFAWADAEHDIAKINAIHGHIDDAITKYKKILENRPNHKETIFELMKILFQKKQIIEASSHYLNLCEVDMSFIPPSFHLTMASNMLNIDSHDFSIATFLHLLKTEPDSVDVMDVLSHAYMGVGRCAEAQDILEKILKIRPNDPVKKLKLAISIAEQGKIDQALDMALPLIKNDAGDVWTKSITLMHYGFLLSKQGKEEEGFAALTKAVEMKCHWPWPDFNLAVSLYRRGEFEESATILQKLIRYGEFNVESWANLHYGRALWKLGRLDEARKAFRYGMNGYYGFCMLHWRQQYGKAEAKAVLEEARAKLEQ